MGNCINLSGLRFGKLTVISRGENTTDNKAQWLCQCDCGNTKLVRAAHLRSGATISCGCATKIDISGQQFGRLTALYRVASRNGVGYFHCRCSCGNELDVRTSHLINGNTKSCGCYNDDVRHMQHKHNEYTVCGDITILYTENGSFLIDTEDLNTVQQYYWVANKDGYIISFRDNTTILLHRLLMNCSDDLVVDHRSGNVTDNRRSNLRVCTVAENSRNRAQGVNSSGYTGIYVEPDGKYRVRITFEGKRINLGRYDNLNQAIVVRVEAEDKYFGEFSRKNSRER